MGFPETAMNKEEVASAIKDVIINEVFAGIAKDVSYDDVLGETGIGLDSLRFLRLLSMLENRFQIQIDDEHWDFSSHITFHDLTMWFYSKLQEKRE